MVNMENQIQLYHDLTAFWLDKEWKTPREKQLEKRVVQLGQENKELRAENKFLQERLQPLKVFENIPCKYCGKPMTNWTREQVRETFENWHHVGCD